MIGGSMTFAGEMKAARETLERLGYEAYVPLDTEQVSKDASKKTDMAFLKELGVGRGDAELVARSDAFLILNYEKYGIKGYIGPGAYRDLSVAWWLKKRSFSFFLTTRIRTTINTRCSASSRSSWKESLKI